MCSENQRWFLILSKIKQRRFERYLLILFNWKKKKKTQVLDAQEDRSQTYSNSCNRGCYPPNGLQAFPWKTKFCMTRIRFHNRKPVCTQKKKKNHALTSTMYKRKEKSSVQWSKASNLYINARKRVHNKHSILAWQPWGNKYLCHNKKNFKKNPKIMS